MKTYPEILTEWAARQELAKFGIAFSACRAVKTDDEAVAAAKVIGFPVVVKVHASSIVHKTEVNGVHLDIRDEQMVRSACQAIRESVAHIEPATQSEGFLVQPYVTGGLDMLLGVARDPSFGPYLLIGLGGIWVEVMADVVAVALPATRDEILVALSQLRAFPLLEGARGQRGSDLGALVDMAARLAEYAGATPEAQEIDINPLRVFSEGGGALALDARIVRGPSQHHAKSSPSPESLSALADPKGVVVVGVSRDPDKFGSRLVNSIKSHGFGRPLWALHPRESQIQGVPAYPSAKDSPHPADLAFITVDGVQVEKVLHEIAPAGVRAAVVFASGFGESGAAGKALQSSLVATAATLGISLVGPNTPGIVSEPAKLYGSFVGTMSMEHLPDGDIVLLTQSGSIGSALMGRGKDRGLAFRAWVATGDEADIGVEHVLDYYADDPGTRVIAMFVEMIRDGDRFRAAARRARKAGKRLVIYAIGRSESGRAAIQSHTGALGGNQLLYDAVFRQTGTARVSDLDEMLDAMQVLDWCPLPVGRRVAVISSSGASCGIAADDCELNGLLLPKLSPTSKARLAAILPAFAQLNNPLDVTAEIVTRPDLIAKALEAVVEENAFDALLITLGTQQGPMALEVARTIVEFRSRTRLPVIISRLGADSLNPALLEFYQAHKLPLFSTPTRSARAMAHLVQQARPT